MTDKRFHLGWFTNFTTDVWNAPFGNGGNIWDGRLHIELAQALERACFDYIMIEDSVAIPDSYGGASDVFLRRGTMAPKGDPAPLAAIIAAATSRLGVVTTLSTTFYPPYLLARLISTLDSIAGGRFGWNIVTSKEDAAAKNFGLDAMPEHDLRYDIADEYLELVERLLDSWEPGAVVCDRSSNTYVDPAKVQPINFEGKYFKSRGPLNTVRSPQGKPVFVQPGGSPRGRQFGAQHVDSIIGIASGVEGMKKYRDDVRRRAVEAGRNPDDIKVLFLVMPVLGETDEDAHDKVQRMREDPDLIEHTLADISSVTDIDFSQFDLDQPLPPLETNGEKASLDAFAQWGSGKTLRQLVVEAGGENDTIELVGSPDTVAEQMGAAIAEAGGDGFLIAPRFMHESRKYFLEITEGLVPALQRRGLVRTEYTHQHLRDTLREF